jgi:hypothetical protein
VRVAVAAAVLESEREAGRGAELGIAGGTSAKMNASRTFDSAPNARPAMPCAECAGPSRSSHGFRVTNASAAFWPLPEKLKPSTLTICETSGWFRKKPSACCITANVRPCVAPGGSCTFAIR